MKTYITWIYSLILTCCLLGCTDEQWLENKGTPAQEGGLPIEFVMNLAPMEPNTRTDGENSIKIPEKTFENKDIIQIVANFYKNTGNEGTTETTGNETKTPCSSVCCILTYDEANDKWVNNSGVGLYWPWEVEELVYAEFQAFYYHGYDGLMKLKEGENDVYAPEALLDLSNWENLPDPLMTDIVKVEYGNAVNLTFKHQCARLVLTDLDKVMSDAIYDRLWLENKKGVTSGTDATTDTETTGTETTNDKNAFRLGLLKDMENNSLSFKFEFRTVKDENRILIGGKKITSESESKDAIVFFLPPGDYSQVALTRRFGYPLLSWDVPAPDSKDTNASTASLNDLEAGKSYTVSLEDLKGNIIIEDDDDWWKDDDTNYVGEGFKLEDFLESITKAQAYSYTDKENNTVNVLEVTKEEDKTYLKLKKGINFNYYTGEVKAELGQGVVFDGGKYFFKNVCRSIFNTVNGTIQNLGIKECTNENIQLNETIHNFGIMARESHGKIDNIRLEKINLKVTGLYDNPDIVNMIGGMIGYNVGTISNIEVNDIFINENCENVNNGTSIMLGGLIGQNGSTGTLDGVTMCGNDKISVTISSEMSSGSIYTGGLVGLSSNNIANCSVRANVDASKASGTWVYTGGLAGAMRNQIGGSSTETTSNQKISLNNSINEGNVTGGICSSKNNSQGHSSTGGLVGYSIYTDILNCKVQGEIASAIEKPEEGKLNKFYTIGGLIGTVRATTSGVEAHYPDVMNNSVYISFDNELEKHRQLQATPDEEVHYCYIGWLAGLAPENIANAGQGNNPETNQLFVSTDYPKVGRLSNESPD